MPPPGRSPKPEKSGSDLVMTAPRPRRSVLGTIWGVRPSTTEQTGGFEMTTIASLADAARRELPELQDRITGPGDAGYDDARAGPNGMIDRPPALIIEVRHADDVAAAIAFARRHDTAIAVRGGGHNGGGLGVVDDGVVIDLAALNTVAVDPDAGKVVVGGGATWSEVDAATAEHGAVVPSGIISTTGVGGLTLGGGLGHLTRGFGLTIDNLAGADVVLADGSQVH